MPLFLGVDGGQSSTVALISDENGRVLGFGKGGPCNHASAGEGRAKFASAMTECLGAACVRAGVDARDVIFEAACLGFSGGVADKLEFTHEIVRADRLKVTIDAEIALTAATGGNPGIVVIAGTGSIAFGKNQPGQTIRVGGWGYIFGDEGGAFDIVRQALRASLAMEEGWGPSTTLQKLLVGKQVSSANDLMHDWYNHFDRKRIAQLAPAVNDAALNGDLVAGEIIAAAGAQLAELVERAYEGLFRKREPATISYVGGVFESRLLTQAFKQKARQTIGIEPVAPLYPPAAGALLEALRESGRNVVISNLPDMKT